MTLPLLIREYLHPLLGGVILAAALGAMMSTVDSVLLLISSLVVNDIYVKRMHGDMESKKAVNIGRIAIVSHRCWASSSLWIPRMPSSGS